jgi:hypothetical protein
MTCTESVSSWHRFKRNPATRAVVSVICLLTLCLCCASGSPQQDQAILYFFNTSGWSVGARNQSLMDNGTKVVELEREQYIVLPLTPGHHSLKLKHDPSKKQQVELDAAAGTTYYVAGGYHPRMPAILSTWSFEEISKDQADKFLAAMKQQASK